MAYDAKTRGTTYLITCCKDNPYNKIVQSRLEDVFKHLYDYPKNKSQMDPFLLHTMIVHESLLSAKAVITALRCRLYDQLDMVDAFAKEQSDRKALELLTNEMYGVSLDADSLLASAEMADMIMQGMISGHQRYQELEAEHRATSETINVGDSIRYLLNSVQCQRRWILSYKSRKDIAMNLVSAVRY